MVTRLRYMSLAMPFLMSTAIAGWQVNGEPKRVAGGNDTVYMQPIWSPTDNVLAFTEAGYRGIWIKDFDDGELVQLTTEPGAGFGFSWSPDGRAIVARTIITEDRRRFNSIKVFDIRNGTAETLSPGRSKFRGVPRWSADNRTIFVMGKRALQTFTFGVEQAAAANKNYQLCYLTSGKIAVTGSASGETQIFEPIESGHCLNLTVSQQFDKMAFEVIGGNMYVMKTDGSDLVDLGRGYRPQWSAQGDYLVYMITADDGHRFTSSDIYIIKSDGTGKTQLTRTTDKLEMNPSWSADGSRIAFDRHTEGAIYLVDIENLSDKSSKSTRQK